MRSTELNIYEVELWLAEEFKFRKNLIIPNVSFGFWNKYHDGHECDILVVRPSGYVAEIEIKRSLSDLKAEEKKMHRHKSNAIREFWFAIPEEAMPDGLDFIDNNFPEAGVLVYSKRPHATLHRVTGAKIKKPKINKAAIRLTDDDRGKLMRLGCLRLWSMRKTLSRMQRRLGTNNKEAVI